MTGLGDRLKEARTAKGYTLDDLQSITKIQKRYLAGIENEDFGSMPGSFYVRAFIKQYAEAVGLDADEMLSLYRDSSGAIPPEEDERQLASPTLSRRGSSRGNNQLTEIMPKIIVALFIIIIVVVAWFLYVNNADKKKDEDVGVDEPITVQDQQGSDDEKQGDGTNAEKEDEAEPEAEPEKVEQVLEHVTTAGEDSTYSLSDAEEFQLEIRTTGDSWIAVQDSAQVERTDGARIMKDGESVEVDVSDTDQVRIRVGRPAATEIYVNGELLKFESDRIPQNIIIKYEKE